MKRKGQVVAHIDLDYFFAQIEELRNPGIADKPVVVCVYSGRTEDSGVVSSANYIARRYGVKAGIPIVRAKALLKGTDAVFLPMRRDEYAQISEQVMEILREFADVVEVESIDEASLDISSRVGDDYSKAMELGSEIKRRIRELLGLKCTIGIACNKVVAKIAADVAKPDGLRIVKPEETSSFLAELPVEKLPGVGEKLRTKLAELGVKTIGDLAQLSMDKLHQLVGEKTATYLKLAARGEYYEPVAERRERKQISRIITLKQNTRDVEEIMRQLSTPINDVLTKAESMGVSFSGVGIIAISTNLRIITRSKTLNESVDRQLLIDTVKHLFNALLNEQPSLMLRRAGVRLFDLKPASRQTSLTFFQ